MKQFKLSKNEIQFNISRLKPHKKYTLEDYEMLLEPYLEKYKVLRYRYHVREPEIGDRKVFLVRHDIARDLYHTDSGGDMRALYRTRGRRVFGRHDPEKGAVVGILAHPVWWSFDC